MPTTQKLRQRLIDKLTELFQLDQPDLDFGFYRIMHAKAKQVNDFIQNDLLKIVNDAFGHLEVENTQAMLAQAKQKVLAALGNDALDSDGNLSANFTTTPTGKTYLEEVARIEQSKSALSAEADIYDHLYRFFERYYDAGDFISRRYYTRETTGKAAPFAVPYNGEEVKLHWANADQYYIKTTEYFNNFTFDLRQAEEIKNAKKNQLALDFAPDATEDVPRKVHFRIVDASEGEHGNVKASEATKRFFLIHAARPVELNEQGELVVNFEYRADPEKSGQDNTWSEKRNNEAVDIVLRQLDALKENKVAKEYLRLLRIPAPTEKEKDRPLLAKYINQYTARNTMDYFIHKDLGSFLRRELDFYIKNEVMRLDDIENADAPAVESYLAKIKVLRKIAGKLIDFMAQLEDFQKKLWLKKKFVVETNYCITLDRVPEDLYSEIASNDAQREEWVRLFAIDEIEESTISLGYSVPLTMDFLKANNKLVLDTKFFDIVFNSKLTNAIEDFDRVCDGTLIHSDNFHALMLMQNTYAKSVNCTFIDPPYNTGLDSFPYKDAYQHSSWMTSIENRIHLNQVLFHQEASLWITLDDTEAMNCRALLESVFGQERFVAEIAWEKVYSPRMDAKQFSSSFDHLLVFANQTQWSPNKREIEPDLNQFAHIDENGRRYRSDPLRKWGKNSLRKDRPNLWYPIESPEGIEVWPIKPDGTEGCWRWQKSTVEQNYGDLDWLDKGNGLQPYLRQYADQSTSRPFETIWDYEFAGSTHESQEELKALIPTVKFPTPKPTKLVQNIQLAAGDKTQLILDYFAGSGTTGSAVIRLNREDKGSRKYILVEMSDYFDTILKPRIAKVVYSSEWKDGKPTSRDTGISHCFKYLRLESYEDTLNNLHFVENPTRNRVLEENASLKEDFMLHYLLDVETEGSQSLLNIDAFSDPTAYTLQVKKPGSDEVVTKPVDLLATFNYLIGLRVTHIAAPQSFSAKFKRQPDPDLPTDQQTKLVIDGRMEQIQNPPPPNRAQGAPETGGGTDVGNVWWFRKVEGWVPGDPANPNNGQRHKVLIVWRNLNGDLEQDNLMLDEWFKKNRISTQDFEFQTIYVNGSNNLPNLALEQDTWKVRLLEEEFMKRMWEQS